MMGMAARAYPEISEILNSGRCKLTKKQRLRNRRILDSAPKPASEEEAERLSRESGIWKSFPSVDAQTTAPLLGTHLKKGTKSKERQATHKMITKSGGNQWTRCKTALRDTYGDMEDKVNTNAGMRTGKGSHDVKVCQWNMGGWDIEKAEDFGLYMQHNNIDIGFLNDIRLTVNDCEIAK